jgi:hypothetical protein
MTYEEFCGSVLRNHILMKVNKDNNLVRSRVLLIMNTIN